MGDHRFYRYPFGGFCTSVSCVLLAVSHAAIRSRCSAPCEGRGRYRRAGLERMVGEGIRLYVVGDSFWTIMLGVGCQEHW